MPSEALRPTASVKEGNKMKPNSNKIDALGLKPCPFCGRKVTSVEIDMDPHGASTIEVRCECGANVIFRDSPLIWSDKDGAIRTGDDAIVKWNRRDRD